MRRRLGSQPCTTKLPKSKLIKMEQPPNFSKAKPPNSSFTSNNSKPPKAKKISISILVISLPVLYVSLLHIPPSTLIQDTTFWFLMSNSIIIIIAADSGVFSSSSSETSDLYEEFIKHSSARSACLVPEPPPKPRIIESPKEPSLAPTQLDVTADKNVVVRENSVFQLEKPADTSVVVKEESLPQPGVEVDKSIVVYEKPLHQSVTEKKDHQSLPPRRSLTGRRNHHRLMGSEHSNFPLHRSITEKRNHQYLEDNEYSKLSDEELNERVEEFIRNFNRDIRLQLRNE